MGNTDEIPGLVVKELISHGDERGFFREIVRVTDPLFSGGQFGQWSHSKMERNVVKAWHYHHVQTDWWYVPIGEVEAVVFDNRPESPAFKTKKVVPMGETHPVCMRIPPGVLHGLKVLSTSAHLFYITSVTYDSNEEGRFPYNSAIVPHDWGTDVIVVANDKREFVPTSTRELLR